MLTDAAKSLQYAEFFMSPNSGRRKLNLGSASVMDTLILGRDTDCSGEDPHKDFMKQFGDHAGKKSGEDDSSRKAQGYSLSSQMDTVIWGRDMDQSDNDPQDLFTKKFGGCAGLQVTERTPRPTKKGGSYALTSTMDTVIWGRDFDTSGNDPHDAFMSQYCGHAGKQAGDGPERPFRKLIQGNVSIMGNVVHGRDVDLKARINERWVTTYGDFAGIKSGQKPDRPYRKPGMAMKSSADNVIWGRDLDQSGDDFHEEHFERTFATSAGRMSGDVGRTMAQKARQAAKSQRLASSRSDPALTHRGSRGEAPEDQRPAASSGDAYVPQPAREEREGELTSARSGSATARSGSATSREAKFRPPSRASSQGSLTYRPCSARGALLAPWDADPLTSRHSRTSGDYCSGCWAQVSAAEQALPEPDVAEPRRQRSSSVGALSSASGRRCGRSVGGARSPRPVPPSPPCASACGAPCASSCGAPSPRPPSEAASLASSASGAAPRPGPAPRPGGAMRRSASATSIASSGAASRPRWR